MAKTNKEFDTVGDLVAFLQTLPQNLPFGQTGHYGEFLGMDLFDFRKTEAYVEMPHSGKTPDKITVLKIDAPDLGDEPD